MIFLIICFNHRGIRFPLLFTYACFVLGERFHWLAILCFALKLTSSIIKATFHGLLLNMQVAKLVRAIREGRIKFDKPQEEPQFYLLWGDDSSSTEKAGHLAYIPAPKPKLPGIWSPNNGTHILIWQHEARYGFFILLFFPLQDMKSPIILL